VCSAQLIGIAVHELVTNALKFASLSNSDGLFQGIATDLR
jgi:two-component sensor histidine kinase